MPESWDVIVIGSGFGGAVTACRLAEAGAKVLVLERGRRWDPSTYPRKPEDPWIYDPERPEWQNGWLDLRFFEHMIIAQGAGVGGGSLVYANVSVEAKKEVFDRGWPAEITYEELKPHYDSVGRMLNVQTLPQNQLTERYKVMKEGAEKLGYGDRFRPLPLAVTFNPEWSYDLEDPFDPKHSPTWVNEQGQEQGKCIHLGRCDIGCDVKAKNTLDLNYLAQAQRRGAQIRPLHLVRFIEPQASGYRVAFDRIEAGRLIPGSERAARVVLAAGSLGSTELLLRSRDQYRTLPKVSGFLGHNWSSNGDFLTPAFHADRTIAPTHGPTISSAIDFLDGSVGGQRFFIEDGGFPDLLASYLQEKLKSGARRPQYQVLLEALRFVLRNEDVLLSNVMPWFAQGIDAADGRLYLGRNPTALWRKTLMLDWDIQRSKAAIDAIVAMHERLAGATGGTPWVPPSWTILRTLVTPHPLGGCNMGTTASDGVVDHRGEVFGYPGLYVADGAVVPEAVGLNPSRTIAALAERTARLMI